MGLLSDLNQVFYLLGAFVIAFVVSLLVTPYSKKLAIKVGAIDVPKARSSHTINTPLAGGTAIVAGFIISIAFVGAIEGSLDGKYFISLIGGGLLISGLGFLDDIYDLSAPIKLFVQILAALIVVLSGITIDVLTWPFVMGGTLQLDPSVNKIATVIWIVGITNAVNFMDGLDGLATGISSIASLCMMFIAIIYGDPISVLLTAALAGACLGFLPHNFSPASIFMGDTGSTFLGFTLAVISAEGLLKSYTAITWVIPIIILGLPIFDTSFAIIRRLANGKSPMEADRGHLHHRLVDKGYSHRRAVLTLYVVASGFGIAGILMALNDMSLALVIIALILIFWVTDYLYTSKKKKKRDLLKAEKQETSNENPMDSMDE